MNKDTRRRVALAAVALGAYAACADAPAEPQHTAFADDKLDYAQPASIEDAADYVLPPTRPTRPPRAARSKPRTPRGGDLPPDHIVKCESGGSYTAENPTSTASGRYQITDGSWNGYGGYSHASDAPPSVQDERARQMWAGGAGWRHWRSCA